MHYVSTVLHGTWSNKLYRDLSLSYCYCFVCCYIKLSHAYRSTPLPVVIMSVDTSSVVKRAIPTYGVVSDDANSLLSTLSLEFVKMLYDQADAKATLDNRDVVTGDDVVWACRSFGLEGYSEALGAYLEKYRESLGAPAQSVEVKESKNL